MNTKEKILQFMEADKFYSAIEISEAIGAAKSTVRVILNDLLKEKKLRRRERYFRKKSKWDTRGGDPRVVYMDGWIKVA